MVNPRIYFYCCDEPGNLQEDIISLAEGLRELGITYYANCNYWLQSLDPDDFLFRRSNDVRAEDCDIVVVSYTWVQWVRMGDFRVRRRPLPKDLFKPGRRYITVAMDNNDFYRTVSWEPEFRKFDLILRSKYNARAFAPSNMRPWAYGLTNRIIDATKHALPFDQRKNTLLVNFNASHPFAYGTREMASRKLFPHVKKIFELDQTKDDLRLEPIESFASLMWKQTGGRYCPSYYARIKQAKAVACFCGDIIPSSPWDPDVYLVGGNVAALKKKLYHARGFLNQRPPRAIGADSFRFWEALAAKCAAINIDLDYYGVLLPEMPTNGLHYLGVKFSHIKSFVEQLYEDIGIIERVAIAGSEWAENYYSPRSVAKRFLGIVGYMKDN